MMPLLVDSQELGLKTDSEAHRGSWAPQDDAWAPQGGRLFVTALSVLTLETPYRHVPLHLLFDKKTN